MAEAIHSTSAKFIAILDEMRSLHLKKAKDYGTEEDPLANIRACSEIGVAPLTGAVVRMMDKVRRIKTFMLKGRLENESLSDAFLDLAAYAVICEVLRRETTEQ